MKNWLNSVWGECQIAIAEEHAKKRRGEEVWVPPLCLSQSFIGEKEMTLSVEMNELHIGFEWRCWTRTFAASWLCLECTYTSMYLYVKMETFFICFVCSSSLSKFIVLSTFFINYLYFWNIKCTLFFFIFSFEFFFCKTF